VKSSAFLFLALAACAQQQRPVVLTPVRMETVSDTPAVRVFDTQRDDPFATTNRIDWPGPNRYRSANGAPGPDYWQQRADYAIAATLDTSTTELTGSVEIRYTNRWIRISTALGAKGQPYSLLIPGGE